MANESASSHLCHPNRVTCSASQEHASLGVLKTNLQLPKITLNKCIAPRVLVSLIIN